MVETFPRRGCGAPSSTRLLAKRARVGVHTSRRVRVGKGFALASRRGNVIAAIHAASATGVVGVVGMELGVQP